MPDPAELPAGALPGDLEFTDLGTWMESPGEGDRTRALEQRPPVVVIVRTGDQQALDGGDGSATVAALDGLAVRRSRQRAGMYSAASQLDGGPAHTASNLRGAALGAR